MTRRWVVVFVLVVLAGAALRLTGSDWDDGRHLHPDERYISIVADNTSFPSSLRAYLDVRSSPLSPYNTDEGQGYIYGTLPLFATKLVATTVGSDAYGELVLVGRRLTAALDVLTIGVVFLVTWLLLGGEARSRRVQGALLAGALYAFTVAAIQSAHFFTTDLWLVFFGTLTFLLALRAATTPRSRHDAWQLPLLLAVGGSAGLTVACKASGAFTLFPVALALLGRAVQTAAWGGRRGAALRLVAETTTVGVTAYVCFRSVSPYTFETPSWLDLTLNESFRRALEEQQRVVSEGALSPPSYQWLLSSRVLSPLESLVVWQLGIPLGVAAVVGLGLMAADVLRTWRDHVAGSVPLAAWVTTAMPALMLLSFVLIVFGYVGTRVVHTGRYLLPIVPLMAVAAAYGAVALTRARARLWLAAAAALVGLTAVYAVSFTTIYTDRNTRLAASDWLERNVPAGRTIVNEHWDDPLPVGGIWVDESEQGPVDVGFRGGLVPVFDPDDGTKIAKLLAALSPADYYVLSSPRAWNTIGRLPDRFPLMTRFYRELFAGRLGFAPVARFTSYPGALGLEVDDLSAEEAFWVYDHPPVTIFRKLPSFDAASFRAALCAGAGETPACG